MKGGGGGGKKLNFEGMPMFISMNLIIEYATAFVLEILIIKL